MLTFSLFYFMWICLCMPVCAGVHAFVHACWRPAAGTLSPRHHLGVAMPSRCCHAIFSVGAGDPNSGPHACKQFNNSYLPRPPNPVSTFSSSLTHRHGLQSSSPTDTMEKVMAHPELLLRLSTATSTCRSRYLTIHLMGCSHTWLGRAHSPSQREATLRLNGHPF